MKIILPLSFLLGVLLLTACAEDEADIVRLHDNSLVGTWELSEILADPGDGSGTFQPVDSDRTLTINADGTVTANGTICNFAVFGQSSTAGSGTLDTAASRIIPTDCNQASGTERPITYDLDKDELILTYLCIEACRHKYTRN